MIRIVVLAISMGASIQPLVMAEPVVADQNKPWIGQNGGTKQWLKRFWEQNAEFNRLRSADFVFVGDSLTEFWSSMGKPVWQREFRDLKVANAGIAADRTQQMVFRMMRGTATQLNPKGYVVMGGTNNLAMANPDSPEDVAKGVEGIVRVLRQKSPSAQILVLSILPNSADPDLAARIQKTNELLKTRLLAIENAKFLNLWPDFSDDAGRLKRELTVDGTHLTEKGYQLLADKIRPELHNWLGMNKDFF